MLRSTSGAIAISYWSLWGRASTIVLPRTHFNIKAELSCFSSNWPFPILNEFVAQGLLQHVGGLFCSFASILKQQNQTWTDLSVQSDSDSIWHHICRCTILRSQVFMIGSIHDSKRRSSWFETGPTRRLPAVVNNQTKLGCSTLRNKLAQKSHSWNVTSHMNCLFCLSAVA